MMRAAVYESTGSRVIDVAEVEGWLKKNAADSSMHLWLDVVQPEENEIRALEKWFGLHPLTIEDLLHRNQRAKVEEYPGYLFVVMHWFGALKQRRKDTDETHGAELHCMLGQNFLVTVTDPESIAPVEVAWGRFLEKSKRPILSSDMVMHRVIDALVDDHVPCVEELEEKLEAINERVIEGEESPMIVSHLVALRREAIALRRKISAERETIVALAKRDYTLISAKTSPYFRDIADHLSRTFEALDALREHTELVTEVHLAFAEGRRSLVVKRLTVISTIFLPLNFIAGFFGMNFTHLPFDSTPMMVAALASMVLLPSVLMLALVKRRWV